MRTTLDRLEPSQLRPDEIDQLERVLDDSPCLVGREEFRLPLPDPIFHLLMQVVQSMRKGEVILLMPEDESLTTKAAADYLGVSRPFLVTLLDNDQIPSYKVGSHRRVKLRDLRTYRNARDKENHAGLRELFNKIQEAGHYEDVL
jgi:excisionase family DNA binding protein